MRKLFIIVLLNFLGLTNIASPKKSPGLVQVTYQTMVNGKSSPDIAPIKLLGSAEASKSWSDKDTMKLFPTIAKETGYIDFTAKNTFQVARFSNGTIINTPAPFSEYPVLTQTGGTAEILGYPCKKGTLINIYQ